MYKSLDDINTKLNGEPEWVLAKPISYDFNSSNVFDYKSLAFLLSIQSGREVFTRLQLAERAYLDLMSGLSEFNESALEKQKKMATSQLGENNFASLGEIERYIGVELVARTRDQLRGIVVKLAHDESRYIKAFESLNRVLVEIFCPDYEVQKIVIQERHAIAQLPNLPDNLKKHVAEQNIDIE
ncbi:hypothetical protein [Sapientia aquatica]|uniref:Uncharacterized protein n=1 Tax=Sapientia aquatica TaxID=1549640 RepID=A0A4V3AUT0_9BURK|nr:hypothetical protein [Sapientia aquatica]TDK65970.1 hypothetical protein E2I14_10270 [Sapientia aquatica]